MARESRDKRNRLYRDPQHAWIAGVCAGIAKFFGISRFAVRLIAFVGLLVATPATIIVYVVAWMILDKPPEYARERNRCRRGRRRESARREWREVRSNVSDRLRKLDQRIQDIEARVTSSEFDLEREFRNL